MIYATSVPLVKVGQRLKGLHPNRMERPHWLAIGIQSLRYLTKLMQQPIMEWLFTEDYICHCKPQIFWKLMQEQLSFDHFLHEIQIYIRSSTRIYVLTIRLLENIIFFINQQSSKRPAVVRCHFLFHTTKTRLLVWTWTSKCPSLQKVCPFNQLRETRQTEWGVPEDSGTSPQQPRTINICRVQRVRCETGALLNHTRL